jgi:hypothetical protein
MEPLPKQGVILGMSRRVPVRTSVIFAWLENTATRLTPSVRAALRALIAQPTPATPALSAPRVVTLPAAPHLAPLLWPESMFLRREALPPRPARPELSLWTKLTSAPTVLMASTPPRCPPPTAPPVAWANSPRLEVPPAPPVPLEGTLRRSNRLLAKFALQEITPLLEPLCAPCVREESSRRRNLPPAQRV